METALRDFKFGLRSLIKNPGFTIVSVITLALGIGVNSAVFSIVNAYLFRPLPVKEPDQLVAIGTRDTAFEVPYEVSYPNYEDLKNRTDVFSDVIATTNNAVNVAADGGQPERTFVLETTGNYFEMLGVDAVVGRVFNAGEGVMGASQPLTVLSYGYWQRRFAGDRSVIGKTIKMNALPVTIIGVAPASFKGTESVLVCDAYVPLGLDEQFYPRLKGWWRKRADTGLKVLGRLKPGVTLDQARASVNVMSAQLEQEYPDTNKGVGFAVELERHSRPVLSIAQNVPRIAAVFMALVALVLLIASANVANLMLARATARRKEIAIRAALGASRGRIVRLFVTESILLALFGGTLGLVLSLWAIDSLANIKVSTDAPVKFDLSPDWRVLAFSVVVAIVTGLVAGVMPALQTSNPNLNNTLKEGGRSSVGSTRQIVRSILVVSQVAISLLVLICAGLFIQSARNAEKMDIGFRTEGLGMLSMDLEAQGYDAAKAKQFMKQLVDRAKALPGVIDAALAKNTPLGYNSNGADVYFEGRSTETKEEERNNIFINYVGPDYFKTMGTPLLQGREFLETDTESSTLVAVVNEAMAKRYWPGQEALGKRFRFTPTGPFIEVVGVARDSKYVFLGEDPRPFFYVPLAQNYRPEVTLFLHSTGDPATVLNGARHLVRELDSDLPVYDVKSMTSHLRDGIALLFVRLGAQIATTFGLLGLVLAVVGVYGVISYAVTQRVHEIGLRLALGAQTSDVLKLVLGHGLMLTGIGVAIGLVAALAVTRVMTSLLYGVNATDPLTFVIVGLALTGVALIASFIPARRAMKVDPMIALRCE